MLRNKIAIAVALTLSVGLPLAGCSGNSNAADNSGNANAAQGEESSDFNAVEAYWGQWRGSVETTGQSVYGNTSGSEAMLDINLEQDGTCTVEPLASHADLLTDEGTWEGTEDTITLHLSSGDIVLTVTGSATCEGDASLFDIADFDTINFDFYG